MKKSHTLEELIMAQKTGMHLWVLDTGKDGEDDTLIGNNEWEVEHDVINHFDLSELPEHWSLIPVTWALEDEEQ